MRELLLVVALLASLSAGCLAADTDGDGGPAQASNPSQAPHAASPTRWQATDCQGASLVWTPPRDRLAEIVAPWTPVQGPAPDRGVFVLFAFECPATAVDGTPTGNLSGGAALVPVEAPSRGAGVEADGWVAVAQATGAAPVMDLFDAHAFPTAQGDGSVRIQRSPVGWQVEMTYETTNGSVSARGGVEPAAESRDPVTALVAPHENPFSLAHGPESMERRTGDAHVDSTGETWISRLDLPSTPFQTAVDTRFDWDFTFRRDAADGGR